MGTLARGETFTATDTVTNTRLHALVDSGSSTLLTDEVVTANILAANVTNVKLSTDAVTAIKIQADAVTTVKILDANVTEAKLATDAVTNAKIGNLAVDTAELAANAVTTAKITDLNVTSGKLAVGAVTANELGTDAVTAIKILADAVTTVKILDANVTEGKLATDAVTNAKIGTAAVDTDELATDAVTTVKITDANVTDAKIATVSKEKLLGVQWFAVADTDGQAVGSKGTIEYNTEVIDTESDYNPTTSIYTVSVAGTYYIQANVTIDGGTTAEHELFVTHNDGSDTDIAHGVGANTSDTVHTTEVHAMVVLAVNDTVRIQGARTAGSGGAVSIIGIKSRFAGFLLSS